ncbi:hypothetical protein BGZ99_001139, partial [Dissophora globulifera]
MKNPFQRKDVETRSNNDVPIIYADEQPKKTHGKVVSSILTVLSPFLMAYRFLRRYTNLTIWIIICMALGIIVGKFAPTFAVKIEPMGRVFIRMIQTVV